MKKVLLVIWGLFLVLSFSGCSAPLLEIEKNEIPNAHVFLYVNSPQETLKKIKIIIGGDRIRSSRILDDITINPDGVMIFNIGYNFLDTENLIEALSQQSTNEVVYGVKTMLLNEEFFKEKKEIIVRLSLIPVDLLNKK